MISITRFLEKRLRLKVNREIGAETQRSHPGTVAERQGTGSKASHYRTRTTPNGLD
jgi:hypothetical protein